MAEEQLDIAQGDGGLSQGDSPAPRIRLSEIGTIGLKQSSGNIYEESKSELRWPNSIKTYKLMSYDAVIQSGLQTIEMMLTRAKWRVLPPSEASEEEKKKAHFIEQCMHDMEHSWLSFMKEVVSYRTYGFCINEKVYRKRLKRLGSRYNDGLIGWRKLPVRSQDTITEFNFSDDGRYLVSVTQDLSSIASGVINRNFPVGEIELPREKILIFTADAKRGNPLGQSPLNKIWSAWKYRTSLQELEAISISRDMGGTAKFSVPAQILDPEASDAEKAALEEVKKIGRNWNKNEQSFIVMPTAYDEDRNKLYDLEIMGVTGGKTYDVGAVIKR